MGKDMGYRFNEERSTPDYPYFEKPKKKCPKVIREDKLWRNCGTKWTHNVYVEPEYREFPDLGELDL